MSEVDAAASREFLHALVAQLKRSSSSSSSSSSEEDKDTEYVIEHLIPVLVPAIVHLLKTVNENERHEHEGEQHVLPVKPLDHLAKYLFRHNPRHSEPDKTTLEMQAMARRLLRK
ncbi:hypothetical protein Gpo141_00003614 [Globisporangium polare]